MGSRSIFLHLYLLTIQRDKVEVARIQTKKNVCYGEKKNIYSMN